MINGAAGGGVAAVSTVAFNPAGVLAGGALIVDGATIAATGGFITASGAIIATLSGSGKESVKELASRILTQRIPPGLLKEFASKGVSEVLDIIPEINQCR